MDKKYQSIEARGFSHIAEFPGDFLCYSKLKKKSNSTNRWVAALILFSWFFMLSRVKHGRNVERDEETGEENV